MVPNPTHLSIFQWFHDKGVRVATMAEAQSLTGEMTLRNLTC